MLIHQVSAARPSSSIADRFYRTLYASMVDPRLVGSAKQAMYLNLLFKALKEDKNHARVKAFVKRFVQVLGLHRPEFICGGLFLLGEVCAFIYLSFIRALSLLLYGSLTRLIFFSYSNSHRM